MKLARNNKGFAVVFAALALAGQAVAASAQQRVKFPDGSGSITLEPGWKIASSGNGAVAAQGADGSMIMLGMPMPVVSRNVERQFPDIPGQALFPGSARVDFSNPVVATLDVLSFLTRKQPGYIANIRLKAVEPVQIPNGRAAFIRYSGTVNGKPMEIFGYYSILPIDQTQGLFYSSVVASPSANYAHSLPAMMKMWNSWSLSDATINKRLQDATEALAKVDVVGTMNSVMEHRRDVALKAAREFQKYIRQ